MPLTPSGGETCPGVSGEAFFLPNLSSEWFVVHKDDPKLFTRALEQVDFYGFLTDFIGEKSLSNFIENSACNHNIWC
jgi:hypothetical protein